MSKTVIALFDSATRAQRAVQALIADGFVNERIQVQSGEEFLRQGNAPPVAKPHGGLYSGIKNFFEEIGVAPASGPRSGEYQPVSPDDAVILLETSDDRADAAAEVLDREGAVDVEERLEKRASEARPEGVASGLEPQTSGKTPGYLEDNEPRPTNPPESIEERQRKTTSRRARIYGPANEPYSDDWAPKGPRAH